MDDKRARCASNGEALPRQRSAPCCGQDVGLISIIDGGRYSVCARYLCCSGCWPRRGVGGAEKVVSLRLDICARRRALPLGFDQWRFGPGRYSILSIRHVQSSWFSGIPSLCLFCLPDSGSGLSSCLHSCLLRLSDGFCQRFPGRAPHVPSFAYLHGR